MTDENLDENVAVAAAVAGVRAETQRQPATRLTVLYCTVTLLQKHLQYSTVL